MLHMLCFCLLTSLSEKVSTFSCIYFFSRVVYLCDWCLDAKVPLHVLMHIRRRICVILSQNIPNCFFACHMLKSVYRQQTVVSCAFYILYII